MPASIRMKGAPPRIYLLTTITKITWEMRILPARHHSAHVPRLSRERAKMLALLSQLSMGWQGPSMWLFLSIQSTSLIKATAMGSKLHDMLRYQFPRYVAYQLGFTTSSRQVPSCDVASNDSSVLQYHQYCGCTRSLQTKLDCEKVKMRGTQLE